MMKKLIVLIFFVSNLIFANADFPLTGITSNEGYGIWLNSRVERLKSDIDPSYILSLDYMVSNSFEIGVEHWFERYGSTDYTPTNISMTYYLENSGYAIGLVFYDVEESDNDYKDITITSYNKNRSWFTIDYALEYDDVDFGFGFLFNMFAISYRADSQSLDEGYISVSLRL